MHPIKILSTLILGIYGCIGISYGTILVGQATYCNQQTYSIIGTNTTFVYPAECPRVSITPGIVLLSSGSVSMVIGCVVCSCIKDLRDNL